MSSNGAGQPMFVFTAGEEQPDGTSQPATPVGRRPGRSAAEWLGRIRRRFRVNREESSDSEEEEEEEEEGGGSSDSSSSSSSESSSSDSSDSDDEEDDDDEDSSSSSSSSSGDSGDSTVPYVNGVDASEHGDSSPGSSPDGDASNPATTQVRHNCGD